MKIKRVGSILTSALVGLVAASFSTYSVADPFSITYTGTIGTEYASTFFPEVNEGESYNLTLVFDNASTNALSQTWGQQDLTCAIFLINDAQDVRFAHDLTVDPGDGSTSGSISTDGAGILTANFQNVIYNGITSDAYDSIGIQLTDPLDWYANDNNDVFFSSNADDAFGDAAGGVEMALANWTNPTPYVGTCAAAASPQTARPIPTMSQWALIILPMFLGLVVFANRRRFF